MNPQVFNVPLLNDPTEVGLVGDDMNAGLTDLCVAILSKRADPDLMRVTNVLAAVSERSKDRFVVAAKLKCMTAVLFYEGTEDVSPTSVRMKRCKSHENLLWITLSIYTDSK
jgi:hypothetical protein